MIEADIKYQGDLVKRDWNNQLVDHFTLTIKGETFDYFTGTGLRKIRVASESGSTFAQRNKARESKNPGKGMIWSVWGHSVRVEVQMPNTDHILNALVRDAEVGMMTFDDFCNDLGLSTDSRTAKKTHKACIETMQKIKRVLNDEQYNYYRDLEV